MMIIKEISNFASLINKSLIDNVKTLELDDYIENVVIDSINIVSPLRERAFIIKLFSEFFPVKEEDITLMGLSVEFLIISSFIKDDIIDASKLRGSNRTIHETYGIATALMVADILNAQSFRIISKLSFCDDIKLRIISQLQKAYIQLSSGQINDALGDDISLLTPSKVMDISEMKAGFMLGTIASLPAIINNASKVDIENCFNIGKCWGTGLQFKNDVEDLFLDSKDKSLFQDLTQGRSNIVLAYLVQEKGIKGTIITNLWNTKQNIITQQENNSILYLLRNSNILDMVFEDIFKICKKSISYANEFSNAKSSKLNDMVKLICM